MTNVKQPHKGNKLHTYGNIIYLESRRYVKYSHLPLKQYRHTFSKYSKQYLKQPPPKKELFVEQLSDARWTPLMLAVKSTGRSWRRPLNVSGMPPMQTCLGPWVSRPLRAARRGLRWTFWAPKNRKKNQTWAENGSFVGHGFCYFSAPK